MFVTLPLDSGCQVKQRAHLLGKEAADISAIQQNVEKRFVIRLKRIFFECSFIDLSLLGARTVSFHFRESGHVSSFCSPGYRNLESSLASTILHDRTKAFVIDNALQYVYHVIFTPLNLYKRLGSHYTYCAMASIPYGVFIISCEMVGTYTISSHRSYKLDRS